MTAVLITDEGDRTEIRCIDHADDDRVCAAISMLMTAVANWVIDAGGQVNQKMDPGYAVAVIPKGLSGAEAVCRLATLAFEQLAETEPAHVSIIDYRSKCMAEPKKGCDTM